jgi:hypothetical protein
MRERANEMPIAVSLIEALRLGTLLAVEVAASDPERLAGIHIVPKWMPVDYQAQTEGWKASVPDRRFVVLWREYSRSHAV